MLFDTPIALIDEARLLALTNTTAEGRQLEYKQQLPGKGYDDVVEFLKDVTAMANTIGGDILYGITEGKAADGNTVAIAVDGIAGEDADKVKQRFENSIRENVKPRFIGHRIDIAIKYHSAIRYLRPRNLLRLSKAIAASGAPKTRKSERLS
jgi:predicted HTH transcriptional regulator